MAAVILLGLGEGRFANDVLAQGPRSIPRQGGMIPNKGGGGGMGERAKLYERPAKAVSVKIQPNNSVSVAMSRDGSRVAAGGQSVLVIYDGSDGHALRVIDRGHEEMINALAFSRDGRWLASGGSARSIEILGAFGKTSRMDGGIINLWDVSTGDRIATIDSRNAADAFTFDQTGRLIASTKFGRFLSIWEAGGDRPAGLQEFREVNLPNYYYHQMGVASSFNDRGDRIACVPSGPGQVFLRDASQAATRTLPYQSPPTPTAVAVSGDGKKLAVIGHDQSVTVWDFDKMTLERSIPPPVLPDTINPPTLLAFSPGGRSIVSGGVDGIVRVWEGGEDRPSRTIVGPSSPVRAIAFLGDQLRFVSGGWYGEGPAIQQVSHLAIWDTSPRKTP